jgi:hypothetical protein
MKLSRNILKKLIQEEIRNSKSVLLEMPEASYSYRKDEERGLPKKKEGESAAEKLFHIAAQASQLEAILKDDDDLSPETMEAISIASDRINTAFRTIMASKRPGEEGI